MAHYKKKEADKKPALKQQHVAHQIWLEHLGPNAVHAQSAKKHTVWLESRT